MCVAIYKPSGVEIPEDILESCFNFNPHGMGFATPKNGVMRIIKGFFVFDRFLESYRNKINQEHPALIHFRYASAGAIDEFNCHPWRINAQICMIHNGTLRHRYTQNMSDTGHFARDVLMPNQTLIFDPDFQSHVENHIGDRNKMAFLDANGECVIYNEHCGEWLDDAWFSNLNFLFNKSCKPMDSMLDLDDYEFFYGNRMR